MRHWQRLKTVNIRFLVDIVLPVNSTSLEKIWSLYRDNLRAFLLSKINNEADVDDLLQEILLKTYQSLGEIKKEDSIKSWLFQVANRTVIDHYRKTNRQSDINMNDLWYGETEANIKAELLPCLEPFVQSLPEDTAELLRSVDLIGVSQKNYAQSLGISYSTLKSRVQKARQDLKVVFEQCCQYHLDGKGRLIDFEQKADHCKKC